MDRRKSGNSPRLDNRVHVLTAWSGRHKEDKRDGIKEKKIERETVKLD